MSARSIATANISFGLVSIPVKLYSATQGQAAISFNMVHDACGGRVKQQYVCPRENDMVVERSHIIKGYEFAKDRYVTFTAEELKVLEEKSTQTIEIAEFVPLEAVDPIYYDKAYYLGPDKGGDRAYKLLGEAMRETGRTALARYAARGKQYLAQLRPIEGGGIVMQQLLYADEVRAFSEVDIATTEVKENELKLAIAIVDQISNEEFKPEQYKDEVKDRIQAQINRKVEGLEIQAAPEQQETQIIDLMEALKASLAKRDKGAQAALPKHAAARAEVKASEEPAEAAAAASEESERKPARRAPRGEKKAAKKSTAS
jgi:DNA end-binding protein Ku